MNPDDSWAYAGQEDAMSTLTSSGNARNVDDPLRRLADDVRAAVTEGSWGAGEAGRLHMWLRADLLPWSMQAARTLPNPDVIGHLLAQLVRIDAEIVASVGEDLILAVHDLEVVVAQLRDHLSAPHPDMSVHSI